MLRLLALVLGSAWLIPVSCTAGLWVFSSIPFEVGKDWRYYPIFFNVLVRPEHEGEPFQVVSLKDLPRLQAECPSCSFLMDKPSGQSQYRSYRVVFDQGSEQVIEVVEDADSLAAARTWSLYRATRSGITPISLRTVSAGTIGGYAMGLSLALYALGKGLRWRIAKNRVIKP